VETGRQAENYIFSFKLYNTPVRKSMHYLFFFIDLMVYFSKNGEEDGKAAARCGNGGGGELKRC
jgi:hypothetical protein